MHGNPASERPAKGGKKVRLLTLDDLDKRTRAAQFAHETRDRVCEDLGGADGLSTLEAIMADNVAVTAAMLMDAKVRWLRGEDVDVAAVATLTNTFNRTAGALGIKRRAREVAPDLRTYIANRAA